jgi:hypothetical protein
MMSQLEQIDEAGGIPEQAYWRESNRDDDEGNGQDQENC